MCGLPEPSTAMEVYWPTKCELGSAGSMVNGGVPNAGVAATANRMPPRNGARERRSRLVGLTDAVPPGWPIEQGVPRGVRGHRASASEGIENSRRLVLGLSNLGKQLLDAGPIRR